MAFYFIIENEDLINQSLDISEFCPECGSGLGLSYNENYGGERCLQCGFTVPS